MTLLFPDLPADHPAQKLNPSVLKQHNSNFEAKLTFAERCSLYALHLRGTSTAMLAAAFGVNRRTVTHLCSPDSSRYRNVRDQFKAMGQDAFMAEYFTETAVERLNAAAHKAEVTESTAEYRTKTMAERGGHASERATSCSGLSTIKLPHHEFSHRIEVAWLDANTAEDDNGPFEHPAGWYWRDLDSDLPERWQGDPDSGSHLTSAKALQHAKVTA